MEKYTVGTVVEPRTRTAFVKINHNSQKIEVMPVTKLA